MPAIVGQLLHADINYKVFSFVKIYVTNLSSQCLQLDNINFHCHFIQVEELENNIWSHTMLPRTLLPEPGYEQEQCRKQYQTCINVQSHTGQACLQ